MRLLLIQFCTVFSLVAFSQNPNKNNQVTIDGLPQSGTYSILFKYSDGDETPLGTVNSYAESMFPQLRSFKMVNKGGDVLVKITAHEYIDLFAAREDDVYGPMVSRYERYWPLPRYSETAIPGYFRPITITIESGDKLLYSLLTVGSYRQGKVSKFDRTLAEKSSASVNMNFMHKYFYHLVGADGN